MTAPVVYVCAVCRLPFHEDGLGRFHATPIMGWCHGHTADELAPVTAAVDALATVLGASVLVGMARAL